MARNTDLNSLFFPVTQIPIFYEPVLVRTGQKRLFDDPDSAAKLETVPGYQAVIDQTTGKIFTIVSSEYQLITNEKAYDLGKECFSQVFNTIDLADMEVFNVVLPKSKSYCHVDLIRREYVINIWKQETWLPYLRITNSYSRRFPLRFALGFCRKLCENGCVFESETIAIPYHHTRQKIAPKKQSNIDFARLKNLETKFSEYMNTLVQISISRADALALVCKALGLHFVLNSQDDVQQNREKHRWQDFQDYAGGLVSKYFDELGENAYAQFNVITDLASRPIFQRGQNWLMDSYQKRAGQWLTAFVHEAKKGDFNIATYLKDEYAWIGTNL